VASLVGCLLEGVERSSYLAPFHTFEGMGPFTVF
jgi:hypothetical protein